jgi:hypothetical protein
MTHAIISADTADERSALQSLQQERQAAWMALAAFATVLAASLLLQ